MAGYDPFTHVSGVPIPSAPVVATGVVEGVEAGKPQGEFATIPVGEGIPDSAREELGIKGPGAPTEYGASFEVSVALERPAYPRPGFSEDDVFVGPVHQNVGPLFPNWQYTVDGTIFNEGQGDPPFTEYINGSLETDQITLESSPWVARQVHVFGLANSSSNSGEAFDIRFYVRQTSGPPVSGSE